MLSIKARLTEPSTWAGLAAGVMTLAPLLPVAADLAHTIQIIGTAICGLAAIWLPEKSA